MEVKWKLHQKTMIFNTTDGAYPIMEIKRGDYIRAIAVRVSETFNNMTSITIGDDTTADGFGTLDPLSPSFQNLEGVYLISDHTADSDANGKLYDDVAIGALGTSPAIKATYTQDVGTPSTGIMTIYIVYAEGVE